MQSIKMNTVQANVILIILPPTPNYIMFMPFVCQILGNIGDD